MLLRVVSLFIELCLKMEKRLRVYLCTYDVLYIMYMSWNFQSITSDLMVNEFRFDLFIPIMDISSLMVHVEQIEDKNIKQVGRVLKMTRVEDVEIFQIHKSRFKKRYSNQVPLNTPRVNKGIYPKASRGKKWWFLCL